MRVPNAARRAYIRASPIRCWKYIGQQPRFINDWGRHTVAALYIPKTYHKRSAIVLRTRRICLLRSRKQSYTIRPAQVRDSQFVVHFLSWTSLECWENDLAPRLTISVNTKTSEPAYLYPTLKLDIWSKVHREHVCLTPLLQSMRDIEWIKEWKYVR